MRLASIPFAAALAAAALSPMPGRAENWPQFRGPRIDGVSHEKGIVAEWGPDKNVLWKTDIPGKGHSSPIVWGGKVYLTTALGKGEERAALCLDAASGQILWQKTSVVSPKLGHIHDENSHASSTPATDGESLFTSFYCDGRACIQRLDLEGKKLWEDKPVHCDAEHGYCYSPILHKHMLIVSIESNDEPATIAYEKNTGKVLWKVKGDPIAASYATPIIASSGGREQIIVCANDSTRALEPSSGKVIWQCKGPTQYIVANPVFEADRVFVNGGYPERVMMCVKTTGRGDVNSTGIAWQLKKMRTYVPSPIAFEGHFYVSNDDGITTCFDAATGDVKWQQRVNGGRTRASLLMAEGNLYTTNDEGKTTVYKADPTKYVEVAVSKLDEFVYASPAVSDGKLFIRTGERLYCFGRK